jgi:hydrophobic/amphiphilic exporter-1 (mainly G- bacteria), HAE1 family
MNLSRIAIRQPVFTTMLMLGLLVLGFFGFQRLSIDEFPDVSIPIIAVQTTYAGASPEAVEREVTRPIEEALSPVAGVTNVRSTSMEGASLIIVEFEMERSVESAAAEVRAKIEPLRRRLPASIEAPIVQTFDPSERPIISIALASEQASLGDLTAYAEDIMKPRLESVSGVASVRIVGGVEREIQVQLRPEPMQALGIGVNDVTGALQRFNSEAPAGRLDTGSGEELLRVSGRVQRPEQFGDVVVAMRNGAPVRLRDVATVAEATQEQRSVAFVNGERAIAVDILKVSGANTVAVADGVHRVLGEFDRTLPAAATLQVVQDNSASIRASVFDVQIALLLGAILTVAVVFLFLGSGRATTITALTLPVSVVSSFILMDWLGFSLNVMTLMGLSLAVGILIDDAIVVIESIMRHRQQGKDAMRAAEDGTKEIILPVVATTFTLLAVFVPVAFMGGIIGQFFFQFALTIAWAVVVSMFVSFTLMPMLSAWWDEKPVAETEVRKVGRYARFRAGFDEAFERLGVRYRGLIAWALDHRKATIGIAAASLAGALALAPMIGGGFVPDADRGQFTVSFETPTGSSLEYTRSKGSQVEEILRSLPGVDYTYTSIGSGQGGMGGSVEAGRVIVNMVPRGERSVTQWEVMDLARREIAAVHGAQASVLGSGAFGGGSQPIEVRIRGADLRELERLSAIVAAEVAGVPGTVEVDASLASGRPERRVEVRRDVAASLGVDVTQVTSTVSAAYAGRTATTWEAADGTTYDVVVRLPPELRRTSEHLAALPIATSQRDPRTGGAVTVPLGQVADIQIGSGPAQIERQRMVRVATITAGIAPDANLRQVSSQVQSSLASLELPAGYTATIGGETEQMQEMLGYALEAILLGIILTYLVLASQFGSFTQPIAIMASLPLSLVGVMLALLVTGSGLNMMSMIGIILLMGLVTKNAILLIDRANEERAAGADRREALIRAGQVRLRPIMMTTLSTIFGMLPIALAIGQGAEMRAPMAQAVIGGIITSTLLTLVVVPVAFTYTDDLALWVKRLLGHGVEQGASSPGLIGHSPEPIGAD